MSPLLWQTRVVCMYGVQYKGGILIYILSGSQRWTLVASMRKPSNQLLRLKRLWSYRGINDPAMRI